MALRNSNNYKVCIVPESSYGVINKTLTTVGGAKFFADKLEWNYAPITVELGKKENSLYKASTCTIQIKLIDIVTLCSRECGRI